MFGDLNKQGMVMQISNVNRKNCLVALGVSTVEAVANHAREKGLELLINSRKPAKICAHCLSDYHRDSKGICPNWKKFKTCHNCGESAKNGHEKKDCPNKPYCKICDVEGHPTLQCRKRFPKRMNIDAYLATKPRLGIDRTYKPPTRNPDNKNKRKKDQLEKPFVFQPNEFPALQQSDCPLLVTNNIFENLQDENKEQGEEEARVTNVPKNPHNTRDSYARVAGRGRNRSSSRKIQKQNNYKTKDGLN